VTAEASRDRLGLASQAGSLSLALDAADTIQAQDSLEKMLVHEMAVIHAGMMKATARMNEELDAAGVIDPNKREAANVRACRLAGAISRMSASYQQGLLTLQRKRTGGNQQVTVKRWSRATRSRAGPGDGRSRAGPGDGREGTRAMTGDSENEQ